MSEQTATSVIIIGAGVSGLLIAHGLKKANIAFKLFELEARDAERRDWGLSLHWAHPLLRDLIPSEIFNNLKKAQVDPFYDTPESEVLPIINGATGEIIMELPFGQNHRISRKKLRNMCATGIDIEYNKKLTEIKLSQDGVIVSFQDGSSATGTTLVGCDGARSKVRDFLLGPEKAAVTILPYEAYFSTFQYPAETAEKFRKLHQIHTTAIHPDGMFCWLGPLDVNDLNHPEEWTFVLAVSGPKNKAGYGPTTTAEVDRLALLKGNAARFAEPFHSALSQLPDNNPVWYIDLAHWEPIPWDNRDGRVTLGGDAAHPMTFYRGQGLNNAILDAVKFVTAMKKISSGEVSRPGAISKYELEVQQRGREEVASSYQNTQMLLSWEKFRESPLFVNGLKRASAK